MPSDTRARLTTAAVERFYREGFRNVGIDQILDDVGISKTAFYKHFQSKDELMLAALEAQNLWLQETFRQMIRERGGRGARDQLTALFDVVDMIIEQEGFQGCIFINASMEFPQPHHPAHGAALANKHAIEEIVFEIAERAGAAAPDSLAAELCMIIDGTYVGRQVTGDEATIATARRLAERTIDAHLGAAGSPPR
jgi:AcrR family transcriptional regulator